MASENINELSKYIKTIRAKSYPIENSFLSEATDYIKNLYLKMLAVVIQGSDDVKEMQTMLFERIVVGAKSEYSVQDYYRQALEISTEDFDNFRNEFKDNDISYRFSLEAILLSNIDKSGDKAAELTVGIMESLGLREKEIKYLAALAKSILCQNNDNYKDAEEIRPEHISIKPFIDYIYSFVSRVICKRKDEEFIAYSYDKNKFKPADLTELNKDRYAVLSYKNVTIKNMLFDSEGEAIKIENAQYVEISDCEFINGKVYKNVDIGIYLTACKKVVFNNCVFRDFECRPIVENNVNEAEFNNCKFIKCKGQRYVYNRYGYGEIIFSDGYSNSGINYIRNCEFKDCGARDSCIMNVYNNNIISNCRAKVENCKFYNCQHIDSSRYAMFINGTENINNEIINSAAFSK